MIKIMLRSRLFTVFAFGLTLVFIFSLPLKIDSQTSYLPFVDTVAISTTAFGANENPMVLSSPGATTTFHINGTVSDQNGWTDISTVTASLYRSGVGSWCTANTNNCYFHPACMFSNSTGTIRSFDCAIEVANYAEPTDTGSFYEAETWNANVTVQDLSSLTGNNSTTNELLSLLSISTTNSINYGNIAVNQTSTSSATSVINNIGNVSADVLISSSGMNCDVGSIPASAQKWNLTDLAYASMQNTLGATGQLAGLNLPKQTTGQTASSDTIYWRIKIPFGVAGGVCSGVTDIITSQI